MRTLFLILLILHGLLHLVGFYRAYVKGKVVNLSRHISKPFGVLWMLSGVLFLFAAVLVILKLAWWPYFALAAVIISQTLITLFWKEAKYGTLLNIIILFFGILSLGVIPSVGFLD